MRDNERVAPDTRQPSPEPLWDEQDLARYYGVSPRTVAGWRSRGQGPAYVRVGGLIRYRPEDVRAELERCRVEGEWG